MLPRTTRKKTAMPTLDIPLLTQKISARYPAVLANPKHKADLIGLIKKGNEDKAVIYAKDILDRKPNLKAHNKIAVDQRLQRREWMIFQIEVEKTLKDIYNTLADKVSKLLTNAADDSGIIPFAKSRHLLKRIRDLVYESYSEITVLVKSAVRKSIKDGLFQTGDAAQVGADYAQEETDLRFPDDHVNLDLVEAPVKPGMLKTSGVFQKIFNRVKKMRIEKGLFPFKPRPRQIGGYATGQPLSRLIWDVRQSHLSKMRTTVANGIAQGRSAISVAKDIEKFTRAGLAAQAKTIGRTSITPSGPGIYASSYKNALRVARTEMNSAYVSAQLEYVKQKGYQVQWHINPEACPLCEPRDGKIYDPEDADIPLHPNCVTEDTLILTLKGSIKISELCAGDMVYGKSGYPRKITKVHKNRFDGFIYDMNGLKITGNHSPFLYKRGWVNAENITERDKIFRAESIMVEKHGDDFPTNFHKPIRFYNILNSFFSGIMPSAAMNFNTSFFTWNRKIDIKFPNSHVDDMGDTIKIEKSAHFNFPMRWFHIFFFRFRLFAQYLIWSFYAPYSIMGVFNYMGTFGRAIPCPAQFPSFGQRSPSKSKFQKSISDTFPADSFDFGYIKNAFPVHMPSMEIMDVESDHFFRHGDILYKIVPVKLKKNKFSGYVYNITVDEDESYWANRILVHNCSCWVSTFIPGLSEE